MRSGMGWAIEFDPAAERELDRLDPQVARRILKFLLDRVANLEDARSVGGALRGSRLGEFWKYRVGDYRIVASIEDGVMRILVVGIAHRREICK